MKHKSQTVNKDCQCNGCSLRFQCFTQERIFSDPLFQGLFEALMAKGRTKEEALEEVTNEMKMRINSPQAPYRIEIPAQPQITPSIPIYPNPNTAPTWPTLPGTFIVYGNNDTIEYAGEDVTSGNYNIFYTMHNGEEINWNANAGELNEIRDLHIHNQSTGFTISR